MTEFQLSQDFNGKPVISATDGRIIAHVDDMMIDPEALEVAAVITSKGRLLKRELELVSREHIQVWGRDAILVKQPDVLCTEEQLPESEQWLAASDQIKGRDVVSIDGTRIGQLSDVILDADGKLASYALSQVFVDDPQLQSKWIPAEATRSLGQDVLVINTEEME